MKWNNVEAAAGMPADTTPVGGKPDVIRVLETALVDARAGRIIGAGVVLALAGGHFDARVAGAGVLEMNMACDAMKTLLLNATQRPQSPIVRARPGG